MHWLDINNLVVMTTIKYLKYECNCKMCSENTFQKLKKKKKKELTEFSVRKLIEVFN